MAKQAKRVVSVRADSLPSLLGKLLRRESVTVDEVSALAKALEAKAERLGAIWQEPGHFEASAMLYKDARSLEMMKARMLAGHEAVPDFVSGKTHREGDLVRFGDAVFRAMTTTTAPPQTGKNWLLVAGKEPKEPSSSTARKPKQAWQVDRDLQKPELPRVIETDEDRKAYSRYYDWATNEIVKGMEARGLDPNMPVTLDIAAPISGAVKTLLAFVSELSRRVAEIEASGIKFVGTWQRAMGYRRGSVVTHQGSAWCAIRDHEDAEEPGKSDAWQLMVKRGADGKDLR